MSQKNISTLSAIIFGILTFSFIIGFYTFAAWEEPTAPPPGGNVDIPINVSNSSQWKTGKLGVATGGIDDNYGLTVGSGIKVTNTGSNPTLYLEDKSGDSTPFVIDASGNVGIGTMNPSTNLHVVGNLRVTGLVNCNTIDTDANGNLVCGVDEGGGGGGGAPTNASYVVMNSNTTLTAERVLTAGNGISISDGGANGNVTISADTGYLQRRVSSSCSPGYAIRAIHSDGSVTCEYDDVGGGGGGAPTNASYVVMNSNTTLTAERVLTAGNGISISDGGANGNVTIEFDCSEVAGTGLACSGEDIYIKTAYRGAEARCGSSYYLRGDGSCRSASQIVSDGGGLTTSNDYGRSGVASNLYEGTTKLSDKYVQGSGTWGYLVEWDSTTRRIHNGGMYDDGSTIHSFRHLDMVLYDINNVDDIVFHGELMPDGDTCAVGQILKKSGSNNWDCAWPSGGGGSLSCTHVSWSGVCNPWWGSVSCPAGYVATGGGIETTLPDYNINSQYEIKSRPYGNGWTCLARSYDTYQHCTCWVRCCKIQ